MPKLSAKVAKQVENAEAATGFALLEEGRYAAQLRSVSQKDGKEYPYWVWEFHNLHNEDGQKQPGRQWNNTSLSPKAIGFLKSTFEAFGYTTDSDTDEMIGEWIVLYIAKTAIPSGPKAGQPTNEVRQVLPFAPEDWPFDPETAGTGATGEDDVF